MNRFLILCFSLTVIFSQKFSLSGSIIDKDTKLSLPAALLRIGDYSISADLNGEFIFYGLSEGAYELEVFYLGFKSLKQRIEISENTVLQLVMEEEALVGDQVLVVADRIKGQLKALQQQKNSLEISNIVASDQVDKYPDANIGDAIKRVSGIVVEYDQGEARFGLIRGTESRLNSITINGDRMPSAEGETRSVQLDLIPADMVQNIEVQKTISSEMDADAIGGSVNLITKNSSNVTRYNFTLGSGYNPLRSKTNYNLSGLYSARFLDSRLGMVASLSIQDNIFGSDNIEAEWTENSGNPFMNDFQVRRYDIERLRQSYSISFDYQLNAHNSFEFSSIFNHRDDWENRYRLRLTSIKINGSAFRSEVRRETKGGINNNVNNSARLERQVTFSNALKGKHSIFDDIELNWSFNYATASEKRPNEQYIQWRVKNVDIQQDLSNTDAPKISYLNDTQVNFSNFSLKDLSEQKQFTEEKDLSFKFDIEIPIKQKERFIKFGFKVKSKDKIRDNEFYEYDPISGFANMTVIGNVDQSDENFNAGDYRVGVFTDKNVLGSIDLNNSSLFDRELIYEEFITQNYSAQEDIYAGYLKYNHSFDKLLLSVGLRGENTFVDYEGNRFDVDNNTFVAVSGGKKYIKFLPSVLAKYSVNENSNIRFAYTNTLARPNYYDLVPYKLENKGDEEVSSGNPNLNASTSMNFDLSYDYYFTGIAYFSAGVFYKEIKDFIFTYNRKTSYLFYGDALATPDVEISQPLNAANADLFGLEIAIQKQLDFLPSVFKNMSVMFNYTRIESSVDGLPVPNRNQEQLSLPGSAKHSYNASISYDVHSFSARISANYSSSFIEAGGIGESSFYDRYYDAALRIDCNASYKFMENGSFYVEMNNLNNQPLRYYQGVKERTMQAEYYGLRLNSGIKFNF